MVSSRAPSIPVQWAALAAFLVMVALNNNNRPIAAVECFSLSAPSGVVPMILRQQEQQQQQRQQQRRQQQQQQQRRRTMSNYVVLWASAPTAAATTGSFIDTQLRGAAMRLHTREQAPREGQASPVKQSNTEQPYVPTLDDYLAFLVDSLHVYEALEEIVNDDSRPELVVFRNTGLERTTALEKDIAFLMEEYGLDRPQVGTAGKTYAAQLKQIQSIPEFVCHYYNFYFAHTAGGRMIGKQMSSLLLNNRTLEFYKWDGNLIQIKAAVKSSIEEMAAQWTLEEQSECVAATPDAFTAGGALNSYLSGGGRSPH